ncbi:MAG: PDZ domain-containing protein [Acidobacteriota bacterium]
MKPKLFVFLAVLMAVGTGEAYPQNMTQGYLPEVNLLHHPQQNYLGVQLRDITSSEVGHLGLPQEAGVFIVRVEEDSPAAEAALREGDVIIQFGSLSVFSVRQFQRLVSETPPGRQLGLTFIRDGKRTSRGVVLDQRQPSTQYGYLQRGGDMPRGFRDLFRTEPRRDTPDPDRPRLGIRGEELTDQLGETLEVPDRKGVLIMEVIPDSPAHEAGLRAGDVITSANEHPISTISELSRYLQSGTVELEIIREKRQHNLAVEIPGEEPQDHPSMKL